MAQDTYDRGMAMRRKVLGDVYVDAELANVDDFTRDFQRLATQYGPTGAASKRSSGGYPEGGRHRDG